MSNKIGKRPKSFKAMNEERAAKREGTARFNGLTQSFRSVEDLRTAKAVSDGYSEHYTRDRGYTGPERKDKGEAGGSCNVTACQRPNSAFYYNHSTQRHYCVSCARKINDANRRDSYVINLGHDLLTLDPQFAEKM